MLGGSCSIEGEESSTGKFWVGGGVWCISAALTPAVLGAQGSSGQRLCRDGGLLLVLLSVLCQPLGHGLGSLLPSPQTTLHSPGLPSASLPRGVSVELLGGRTVGDSHCSGWGVALPCPDVFLHSLSLGQHAGIPGLIPACSCRGRLCRSGSRGSSLLGAF